MWLRFYSSEHRIIRNDARRQPNENKEGDTKEIPLLKEVTEKRREEKIVEYVFTYPSTPAGYDARSIFSGFYLTSLNSEFSFS